MIRSIAVAALAAVLVVPPLTARAQPPPPGPTVEADPVRCWWRTDRASIRMGEPFEAVLTCAVLETPSTKAVVDRTRLDHTVLALPPFDVLGGSAGEDAVTGSRRFFQYIYQLRLLNDTAFGQDVRLGGLSIGYRMDTATGDGTTSQGRDQTYGLPALSIRVLSLVAGDARDIRDTTAMTFSDLETRRFRARALGMAGWFFYALAFGVAALGLVRMYSAVRAPAVARVTTVSGHAVLKAAGRELAAVSRERQAAGWTDTLVGRASAALRIVASYAIGRPAAQSEGLAQNAQGGHIALSQGLLRRRHALVSASVTPHDLAPYAEANGAIQIVRDGLLTLTASRFGHATLDDSALDNAISAAGPLASSLALKHTWPVARWRALVGAIASWRGRA
ncbi:MAG TPA: hypothetical protein VMW48_18400 [Vicinamibacterales bacterium]|nr:hypothetical protein [Vicinamibacterales bacterium]